jgi:hypothetical protein
MAGVRLDRIEQISAKFAEHLEACVVRYADNRVRWQWAPSSIRSNINDVVAAFADVFGKLQPHQKEDLVLNGMDALKSDDLWAHVENVTLRRYGFSRKGGDVKRGFLILNSIHQDEPCLKSPSVFQLGAALCHIQELYKASTEFLLEYKQAMLKIDAGTNLPSTALTLELSTFSLLKLVIEDQWARRVIGEKGLEAFVLYPKLFNKIENVRTWQPSNCMDRLMEHYDPVAFNRGMLTVLGHIVDMHEIWSLSQPLYDDLAKYAETIGRNGRTVSREFARFQAAILRAKRILPSKDMGLLKEKGLVSFVDDDYRILLALYQKKKFDKSDFGYIKRVVDAVFPEKKKDIKDIVPYHITFDNVFADRPLYVDYGPIRDLSIILYEDLVKLLDEQKATIDQKNVNSRTLHHRYSQLKTCLILCRHELEQECLPLLQEHGMKAFNLPRYKLQKTICQFLQDAARNKTLATISANGYKKTLKWFLTESGFHIVDAYPIRTTKITQHLKRLNTDDYYSAEQCREIAFHIECLLEEGNLTCHQSINLLLARILLKTCWNLAPTLDIECEDIVRTSSPLNPNVKASVVVRKARAGYRTDAYTFEEPKINVTAMRSAVSDLEYVRDKLTADLRSTLSESNPYKKYVFIIKSKGVVKRLSCESTATISKLLKSRGCTLTFDSMKIRKGGVNHVYRQVQKDLEEYEAAVKQDFKTFQSHYYRIDENQSRYTLGKAVGVMEDYFQGKEISKDIIIITEPQHNFQHTPPGECASLGSDPDAIRYNLEHKRLHAEKGSELKFCADYLSCVWCKFFRLVADPEHVWKLLSYREYVLLTMDFSAVEGEAIVDQQKHIKILRDRVDEMLAQLDKITPGVTDRGRALIRDKGMHPDWAYVMPDVTMHGNR